MRQIKEIELSAGTIRYREKGQGRPIVFVHGLFSNGELWRDVAGALPQESFRAFMPDWPLGSHPASMKADADLSPSGVARLIGEFLIALDLSDVTLVANDTGGAIAQLLVVDQPERIGRLVLTPSDAFDNFFPPIFRPLQYLARVPGLLTVALQPLRVRALRRLPMAFGWLAKRPIPSDLTDEWLRPFLTDAGIRRDTARLLSAVDPQDTIAAAKRFHSFQSPVLLAWAIEDRLFPIEHGQRLSRLFPNARLEEIPDSYTFVPIDQPARLASLLREFAESTKPQRQASDTKGEP